MQSGNERRKASRPPWLPEETLPRPPQQQQQVEGASYMSKGDPNPRIHHNQKVHQGFHRENLGLYGMPHQQQQQQQQQQVHVQPSQRPPDGPVQNNAHPAKRAEQRGPASYHQPDDFPQARQAERTHQQERHQPNPQPTPHQGDRRHYPDRGAFPPQPQLQPQPQPQLQLQPRQQQQQQHQQRQPRSGPDDQPARRAEDDTELQKALHGFRRSLKARGARGVSALRRKFRVFDDNGNGKLEWEEFHKGLREHHMSPKEMHMLFAHFDRDGSGCVDYDEFLVAVSEPMNARRRELVEQAFRTMDVDGSGMIDLHDVMQRFSAHKHPDVAQGKRSAGLVLREFLDTFDGGVKDGRVDMFEFMQYYQGISCSIDDDAYFEAMMRGAWKLPTKRESRRIRVAVTHDNGLQTVEELKREPGLAENIAGIKQKLLEMGMYPKAVHIIA